MDTYEKKYREALERAKKELNACYSQDCDAARQIFRLFPELKESEDEKVRNHIRRAISVALDYSYFDKETANNCLAWLGKQGKPSDEEMKDLLRTEYEKGRADAIAEMQGEWSEEDIIHLNNCISYMSRLDSSEMDWLKSLKGRVQPKQEWSKEDKKMLNQIIKDYERGNESWLKGQGSLPFGNRITWLKSLKDRVQPQKQEWSEEDSHYRNHIIQIIEEINNAPLKRREDWGAYINWLKSLRPQNRWKPSERQLVCLQNTIEHYNLMGSPATTLNEILKQLKKLKEEQA